MSDNLASSLIAAQRHLPDIHTDSQATVQTKTGGQFGYKYLSLPALLKIVLPVLNDQQLGVSQMPSIGPDGRDVLTTTLFHASGETLVYETPLVLNGVQTPQTWGGSVTYARRYALTSLLGIAADEDDDGAAASKPAPRARQNSSHGQQASQVPAATKTAAGGSGAKPAAAPDPDFGPNGSLLDALGEIDVLADALATARGTDKTTVLKALTDEYKDWRTDPVDVHRAKARLVMWGEKLKEASAA